MLATSSYSPHKPIPAANPSLNIPPVIASNTTQHIYNRGLPRRRAARRFKQHCSPERNVGEIHPLTGLMYCADYGGKMYVHRTYNGQRILQYTCSQYGKYPIGTLCQTQHRINASVVMTLIADMLKAIAEYSKTDRAEFIKTVQEAQAAQQTTDISKKTRRLAAAQKRAGELERLICKIYEDNALDKLPDARYAALDAQYAKEQDELSARSTGWKRQSAAMRRAGNRRRSISPLWRSMRAVTP